MPNIPDLKTRHLKNIKGLSDRKELLKHLPRQGIAAELGVYKGNYSQKIIKYNNPQKLYLIDHWENSDEKHYYNKKNRIDIVKNKLKNEIKKGQVILKQGRSEYILKEFSNNCFDWIYLDTLHTYEQVKKELMLSARKVKDEGYIAGHDFIKHNPDASYQYGVIRAVKEFCVEYNYGFEFLTFDANHTPSYALKKVH